MEALKIDIDLGFDPNMVKTLLENETWETSWQDEDTEGRGIYLGTVFALLPSGKYYTPFACGNVEACEHCKGKGCDLCGHLGSMEAYHDSLWWEKAEALYDSHGFSIESGEGDPCDILAVEYREKAQA